MLHYGINGKQDYGIREVVRDTSRIIGLTKVLDGHARECGNPSLRQGRA